MERIIIYLLVLVNLGVGLRIYYRRPRPFGKKSYESYFSGREEKNKSRKNR